MAFQAVPKIAYRSGAISRLELKGLALLTTLYVILKVDTAGLN
jgi:Na+/H+-translocating membrane pyrophosphatase